MSYSILEKTFRTTTSPESTFSAIENAMLQLELSKLKIKKSIRPSYLLMEYKEGFMQKGEIQFSLHPYNTRTEFTVEWKYPSTEQAYSDHDYDFDEKPIVFSILSGLLGGSTKHSPDQLIEELKHRIEATEVIQPSEANIAKEIIREKEVIVKVRCAYCQNLYDETLDKCPTCGATS